MQDHFFQQVRLRIRQAGQEVKFRVESNKNYRRIKGVFVAMPQEAAAIGATLGLRINGMEVFSNDHEVRSLTSNNSVAPNDRFFLFEEDIVAAGTTIEGVYRDGQGNPYLTANGQDNTGVIDPAGDVPMPPAGGSNPFAVVYAHDIKIILWLTNQPLTMPHNAVAMFTKAYQVAANAQGSAAQIVASGQPNPLRR